MLRVTDGVEIPEAALEERFVRASGPGGQNVNKVSTAVELRFDVTRCETLPSQARHRLRHVAGRRMTSNEVLIIKADRFRTQELNRSDARQRLVRLVRHALVRPKPRIATKPSRAERERRLTNKRRRSDVKSLRRSRPSAD